MQGHEMLVSAEFPLALGDAVECIPTAPSLCGPYEVIVCYKQDKVILQ